MFSTTPLFLDNEADYRREELRRAWGGRSMRSRRRVMKPGSPDSSRVAVAP